MLVCVHVSGSLFVKCIFYFYDFQQLNKSTENVSSYLTAERSPLQKQATTLKPAAVTHSFVCFIWLSPLTHPFFFTLVWLEQLIVASALFSIPQIFLLFFLSLLYLRWSLAKGFLSALNRVAVCTPLLTSFFPYFFYFPLSACFIYSSSVSSVLGSWDWCSDRDVPRRCNYSNWDHVSTASRNSLQISLLVLYL